MNQSEFPAITWNLLKEGEKCTHKVTTGLSFASHLLKNRVKDFKPITKHSNNCNRVKVITFNSHALT